MPTAVWCDSKAVPCFAPHGSHTPLLGPDDLRPDREAFFFRLSATRVILRNRCDQHARGGLVLDQAVTDDIDRVGVALAPEGRDGAADIIQTLGEIETRTQS